MQPETPLAQEEEQKEQKTYLCTNNGKCCECVAFHQVYGGVPACFSVQGSKTISEQRLEDEIEKLKEEVTKLENSVVAEETCDNENVLSQNDEENSSEDEPIVLANSYFEQDEKEDEDASFSDGAFDLEEAMKKTSFQYSEDDDVQPDQESSVIDIDAEKIRLEKERQLKERAEEDRLQKEAIEKQRLELAKQKEENETKEDIEAKMLEEAFDTDDIPGEIITAEEGDDAPPLFIEVFFRCCGVYGKLYSNLNRTHYVGKCPKCKSKLTAPYGDSPRFGLRQ